MKISAAMIVKNESRCIERCLLSIVHAVNEIIVVDTGSNDSTISIIESLMKEHEKIKLYHFEWCDDFSKARNFSLSKVTGDWVFVIDADEYLHKDDVNSLRKLGRKYFRQVNQPIAFVVDYTTFVNGKVDSNFKYDIVRFFPKNKDIFYRSAVHEFLTFDNDVNGLRLSISPIRIFSDGYDAGVVDLKGKQRRNIHLLNKMLESDPENGALYYYLGVSTKVFDMDLADLIFQQSKKLLKVKKPFGYPDVSRLLDRELENMKHLKSIFHIS